MYIHQYTTMHEIMHTHTYIHSYIQYPPSRCLDTWTPHVWDSLLQNLKTRAPFQDETNRCCGINFKAPQQVHCARGSCHVVYNVLKQIAVVKSTSKLPNKSIVLVVAVMWSIMY